MSHASATVEAPVEAVAPRRKPLDPRVISPTQMLIEPAAHAGRTGATLAASLCLHLVLLVAVVLVPLLSSETLPNPVAALNADRRTAPRVFLHAEAGKHHR